MVLEPLSPAPFFLWQKKMHMLLPCSRKKWSRNKSGLGMMSFQVASLKAQLPVLPTSRDLNISQALFTCAVVICTLRNSQTFPIGHYIPHNLCTERVAWKWETTHSGESALVSTWRYPGCWNLCQTRSNTSGFSLKSETWLHLLTSWIQGRWAQRNKNSNLPVFPSCLGSLPVNRSFTSSDTSLSTQREGQQRKAV